MKKILWIASYPKSGNTFMRSILTSLIYTDDGKFNFDLLQKIKQFDVHSYFKFIKKVNNDDYKRLDDIKISSKYWKDAQKRFFEIEDNYIFKTHAANLMWEKFKYTDEERSLGLIYLVRDPRDIVISYANHSNDNIDNVINFLLKKNSIIFNSSNRISIPLSSWDVHIQSWDMLKVPKYIVRYEDLISDTEKILSDLIKFLEKELKISFSKNEAKLNTIINSTKFDRLQKIEKKEGFSESKNIFFRKGKSNQWRKILTSEQQKKIEKNFSYLMQKFNYL